LLGLSETIPAGPLAAGWIITSLLWRLPDPYWLVSMLPFLFMLPVQALANRINATVAPRHDPNRRFTAWNWVGVVFGVIFMILIIVGMFLPDP
jgi:hypothetical protein